MRRLIPTLILAALATSAFAQLTERTTPRAFEELRYSWASDGSQYVLSSIGVYEVTIDAIEVLP